MILEVKNKVNKDYSSESLWNEDECVLVCVYKLLFLCFDPCELTVQSLCSVSHINIHQHRTRLLAIFKFQYNFDAIIITNLTIQLLSHFILLPISRMIIDMTIHVCVYVHKTSISFARSRVLAHINNPPNFVIKDYIQIFFFFFFWKATREGMKL